MHGVVLNGGTHGKGIWMQGGCAVYTAEIALRLNKASALATAAESLSSQGLTQHAFTTLLDVEPLIFESTALLNAASIVNRGDTEEQHTG
ncbi:MAG TPA: hypothetical protein VFR21_31760 [Bradyrhizobium sp.]|jgi:hypothetical protein|nr:hypothetical protein [Bradyrhizobium sp.]